MAGDDLILGARLSDSAEHQQDQQDGENQTYGTAWNISPTPAIWPCGDRSDQKQDQYDEKNGAKRHNVIGLIRIRRVFRDFLT